MYVIVCKSYMTHANGNVAPPTLFASEMKARISVSKDFCILTEAFSSQLHTECTSL